MAGCGPTYISHPTKDEPMNNESDNHDEPNVNDVVSMTVCEAQERAQTDIQIATAKRYPRGSLAKVKQRMLDFATLDMDTAMGCFYTLPPRRGGDGKAIVGPSARLAEIAVTCYGHIKAAARIVANDGKFITAQGVCHDLENNVAVSVEVKRRITNKEGRTFSDDMQVVTGNAACSIALRNAVFKVVPMALIKPVYDAARKVAIGDIQTLAARRVEAFKYFIALGVTKEKVCAGIGVATIEEVNLDKLELLIGLATAIKDGDTTVEEAFAPKSITPLAQGPTEGLAAATAPAPVDKPKTAEKPKADKPKESHTSSTESVVYTEAQRKEILERIQNAMLDKGITESKVMAFAKRKELVPEGIEEVSALPTANLLLLWSLYFTGGAS